MNSTANWNSVRFRTFGLEPTHEATMTDSSVEKVASWTSVLAAMLYLATFVSVSYALYGLAIGNSFLEFFASAYPRAFAACVVLFVCCAAFETGKTALRRMRGESKPLAVHSLVHR